jgi:hypothetical protein
MGHQSVQYATTLVGYPHFNGAIIMQRCTAPDESIALHLVDYAADSRLFAAAEICDCTDTAAIEPGQDA